VDGDGYGLLPAAPWAQAGAYRTRAARLRNLADGSTRPVVGDGVSYLACTPVWCAGQESDQRQWLLVRRPDGSGTMLLATDGILWASENPEVVTGHTQLPNPTGLVWDLRSGRLGTFPWRDGDPTISYAFAVPNWSDAAGRLVVLDPTAIG
jgi:hypothetical protein